jgi:outer membrane protein TolC
MFATRDKLAEILQLGELTIKNQVINTVASVINTYYDIVRQKQQLVAVEEQMSISEERVKLAQYKLDIGVGTKPDVLQSMVDLNEQKAAQLQQRTLISQLKDQLNELMNVTNNVAYDVSDSIPINHMIALADIQNNIQRTNPSLLIAEKNIDIAKYTLRERRADRWPTIGFNTTYNFNRLNNTSLVSPFSPQFNRNHGFNYGLTATIPIFNNYNVRRLIQQAQLDIDYRNLYYQSARATVDLAILNYFLIYYCMVIVLTLV